VQDVAEVNDPSPRSSLMLEMYMHFFCAWVENQRDGSCCEILSLKQREQMATRLGAGLCAERKENFNTK
jgi:hypothetical protein